MGMKNAILSLSIIAILTICMFNNVAAAPVSKQTTDIHSNYAGGCEGRTANIYSRDAQRKCNDDHNGGRSIRLSSRCSLIWYTTNLMARLLARHSRRDG